MDALKINQETSSDEQGMMVVAAVACHTNLISDTLKRSRAHISIFSLKQQPQQSRRTARRDCITSGRHSNLTSGSSRMIETAAGLRADPESV